MDSRLRGSDGGASWNRLGVCPKNQIVVTIRTDMLRIFGSMSDSGSNELRQQALLVNQALLGFISPNFRMVSITEVGKKDYVIDVVLEKQDSRDLEDIDDIGFYFETFQITKISFDVRSHIDAGTLIMPMNGKTMVVFRRREN